MNEKIRMNQKLWDADESAMLEIYDYLIKLQTECDRLYRITELNEKLK